MFNTLCPLIPKEDAYLAPLYNTNLMKYLISYSLTEQLDFINDDPWLLLLSDVFILAYKDEDTATVERILDTIEAMKDVDPTISSLIEAIEVEDLTEYSKFPRKSTHILLHYFIMKRTEVQTEECEAFMDRVWIMYYRYRLAQASIKEFVQTEAMQGLEAAVLAKYTDEMISQKFYTSKEVIRYCKKSLVKEMASLEATGSKDSIALKPSAFTSDVNNDISYKLIKTIFKEVVPGVELKSEQALLYLAHCESKKANCELEPLTITLEEAKVKLSESISNNESSGIKKRIMYSCMDEFKRRYFKIFKANHWGVKPKSWEEIVAVCKERGIDYSKLEYNETTRMLTNACMSDKCPHQYVPTSKRKLANHMGGWQGMCPRNFHGFVRNNLESSTEEIYTKFLANRVIKDIARYGVTKDQVIEYIQLVKESFNA
jgi:hypothetical protein